MPKILSAPLTVAISITTLCNLRCKHCFSTGGEPLEGRNLDRDEWLKVVDDLAAAKVFSVTISGGEPLVVPWFRDVAQRVVQNKMSCGLNTNALLVDSEMAKWLKGLPMNDRVSVSFDGSREETYEMLRGKGTFKKALAGIENLMKAGLRVRLFCVVNRFNCMELEDIIKAGLELGCRNIEFNTFYPTGCGSTFEEELQPDSEQLKAAFENALVLEEKYKDVIRGVFLKQANLYRQSLQRTAKGSSPSPARIGCGAGLKNAAIRSDGTLVPCEILWRAGCGNVLEQCVQNIWQSSDMLKSLRNLAGVPLSEIEVCKDCNINDICDGGCRSGPLSRGEMLGTDVHCWKIRLEKE